MVAVQSLTEETSPAGLALGESGNRQPTARITRLEAS
jgi:hypothetical protein